MAAATTILLLAAALLCPPAHAFPVEHHLLFFDRDHTSAREWDLNGHSRYDTHTNTLVLVPDEPMRAGTAFYTRMIQLSERVVAKFDFRFVSQRTAPAGEGFGFVLADAMYTPLCRVGYPAGGLGMAGLTGYGVEFDVVDNRGCGDAGANHVAINTLTACADPTTGEHLPTTLVASVDDRSKSAHTFGDLADGTWRRAVVTIDNGFVSLAINGRTVLSTVELPDFDPSALFRIGFTGSTGSIAFSQIDIRDVDLIFGPDAIFFDQPYYSGEHIKAFHGETTHGWTFNGGSFFSEGDRAVTLVSSTASSGSVIFNQPIPVHSTLTATFDFRIDASNGTVPTGGFGLILLDADTAHPCSLGAGGCGLGMGGLTGIGVEFDVANDGGCGHAHGDCSSNHVAIDSLLGTDAPCGRIPHTMHASGDVAPHVGNMADGRWRTVVVEMADGALTVSIDNITIIDSAPLPTRSTADSILLGLVAGASPVSSVRQTGAAPAASALAFVQARHITVRAPVTFSTPMVVIAAIAPLVVVALIAASIHKLNSRPGSPLLRRARFRI